MPIHIIEGDSRLTDARTPTAHATTHTTGADKIATGTPDGTKYLRDDFSWQTVVAAAGDPSFTVSAPSTVVAGTVRTIAGRYFLDNRLTLDGRLVLI